MSTQREHLSLCTWDRAWFAVRINPRQEELVAHLLGLKGLNVFTPKFRYATLSSKAAKKKKASMLFPGYVFAQFAYPEEYNLVRWCIGVKHVVEFGGTPIPVESEVIEHLQTQTKEDGCIVRTPDPLRPGQKVKLVQGPFAGLCATVLQQADAHHRVRVLLDCFHSAAQLLTEAGSLRPA